MVLLCWWLAPCLDLLLLILVLSSVLLPRSTGSGYSRQFMREDGECRKWGGRSRLYACLTNMICLNLQSSTGTHHTRCLSFCALKFFTYNQALQVKKTIPAHRQRNAKNLVIKYSRLVWELNPVTGATRPHNFSQVMRILLEAINEL